MAAQKLSQEAFKLTYRIGKVLPSVKSNAARIKIPIFELDTNLNMYFRNWHQIFAYDPEKICKSGDLVLIHDLPKKMTRLITHQVIEVIYPCGDVTDPITNEKVVESKYRSDIKKTNELYGYVDSGFDYDKASPRGRLEGVRDFTDKPTYNKHHEDPDDPQPYAYD